ncbi:AMP-binding protein [Methylobacillus gramineus]|uniref:AMP-binding protein n=1 Tax=Methylobacillus gramineus TaxID=755169 RepID=UPI001CFF9CA9|nr:AMP-binding protein [Methylobacillus gramineus]MCB5183734.1 AMP-binding protein [Methylobacillus gramineus]
MLTALSQLFSHHRAPDQIVCHDGNQYIHWARFSGQVAWLAASYALHPQQRWLLSSEDALDFIVRLFALLHAGKEVVIPPNFQPGTKQQLIDAYDADAASITLPSIQYAATLQPALNAESCLIHLYTSGSTGLPKQVSKTLGQLEREIAVLEHLWGAQLGNATIIASVPHHHIYGLLFRLLWPLSAGRAFDVATSPMPDILLQQNIRFGHTVLVSSPAQLARLPDLMPLATLQPQLAMIFSSGGPLPPAIAAQFRQDIGVAPTEIFGSTESGGIAWRTQTEDCAWTPFPGIVIAADPDQALLLHSPILGNDQPYRMEDAVQCLPDQRFELRGRLDRIVKIEEKRLSLLELEQQLINHPWVTNAAAAVLQRQRQAVGVAIILNMEGARALEEQGKQVISRTLRHSLAQHFDAVLLPRYWRFPEALPLNERGKLTQAALVALFQAKEVTHAATP